MWAQSANAELRTRKQASRPSPLGKGDGMLQYQVQHKKKYRQYSNQGVKCSYHTHIFNGGKNIVLHTFYTI